MSNLKAIKRESTSSGSNNSLRLKGFIPAILYGGKEANQNISIEKKDIKKLVKYVEDLPKVNQINIYENVLREIGRHTKEQNRGKHSVVYKKNVLAAGRLRRENADIALGYKNPKWLAPTIFESYLRSESEKMSFNKGAEIRKYLFLKMKKLIPNNHNLKILLTINNIK